MVAPVGKLKAVLTVMPSLSKLPATTLYLKLWVVADAPVPLRVALTITPVFRVMGNSGLPVMMTASLKVRVKSRVSPAM